MRLLTRSPLLATALLAVAPLASCRANPASPAAATQAPTSPLQAIPIPAATTSAILAPANPAPAAALPPGPAAANQALPASASVDQLLDALDQTGQALKNFSADVSMTEGDPNVSVTTRTGKIWFEVKGDGDGRIHVLFESRQDGQVRRAEKIEYLLDNGWLIDRNYRKQVEVDRQVTKPGEKVNLLKLGQGPFPLPIGQKKQDVSAQFAVKPLPLAKEDGPGLEDTIHVQLKPKPGSQFFKRFSAIDVWVDRATRFPIQIHTDNPDESDPRTTRLTGLNLNPAAGLPADAFKLPPVAGWSVTTEPYKE